jgi:hypothetical protein
MQGTTDPKDTIKLDCASCHALDASDDGRTTGPARAAGNYVLPVTYDQHCKACHPLTFSSDKALAGVQIPHHLQPGQVREFLGGVFAREAVKDSATPGMKKFFDDFPLPGDNRTREQREEGQRKLIKGASDKATKELVTELPTWDRQANKTARYVFPGYSTCGLCHHYEAGAGGLPERIVPVNVPAVWFEHARFSHGAHRTVACLECHGGKDGGKSVFASDREEDVLIPPIENCKKCHSTARTSGGVKQGGVRQDCVTCHSYHHGDKPLAGPGSEGRGARKRMTVQELLDGAAPK